MSIKTVMKSVTFRKPFQLPGMDRPHAPGVFDLQVDEEPLDVMWEGYHRTLTLMVTSGGMTEAIAVTETDLEAALASDTGAAA